MNEFLNSLYNSVGSEVSGYHNEVAFLGTITDTRVKYGTDIQVTVVDGTNTYLIDGTTLAGAYDACYSNLHIYFK